MTLYSHAPSTGSICQMISDIKSISSEKRNASEQVVGTCVELMPSFCPAITIMCQQSNHVRLDEVCVSVTRAVAGPAVRKDSQGLALPGAEAELLGAVTALSVA
jgi:hypothetical protein